MENKKRDLIRGWNTQLTGKDIKLMVEEYLSDANMKYEIIEEPPMFWVWNYAGERYQYFYLINKWAPWPRDRKMPPSKYYSASSIEWFVFRINDSYKCQEYRKKLGPFEALQNNFYEDGEED